MTSADVEINGERYAIISGRLASIERENHEIHDELREMHTEMRAMTEELHVLAMRVYGIEARMDDMKFYVSLSFGALAVFVGLIICLPRFLQRRHLLFRYSEITSSSFDRFRSVIR